MRRRPGSTIDPHAIPHSEASLLRATQRSDLPISGAFEELLGRRGNIVTSFDERLAPTGIRVLVELETQLQDAMSMGSTRSRVISAA